MGRRSTASDPPIDLDLLRWVKRRERFLRWWMEAEKKTLYGTIEAHYHAGELRAFAIRGIERHEPGRIEKDASPT